MCRLCETKTIYTFTNKRKLCKACFIRYFQKKFLYTNRRFKMISKGDSIYLSKSKNFRSIVLEDVLKILAEKTPITFTTNSKKASKEVGVLTTDLVAYEFTKKSIEQNKPKLNELAPVYKKIVHPLYLFLDAEFLLYAKLRKLKHSKITPKKDKISSYIDELEKKHPEIKRAIVQNYLKFF